MSQARIAMLFLSSETRYGKPASGPWQHLARRIYWQVSGRTTWQA
ncbi:hypothetical protein [Massilia violaceinigra]|nr:hypothetical protein [Massilia violaceinigra]